MRDKIHKDRESAKKACQLYMAKVEALMEIYGTWEVNDDSNVETYVYTQYFDANGSVHKYSFK